MIEFPRLELLAQRLGASWPNLVQARQLAARKLADLNAATAEVGSPDVSVVMFGSVARGELTQGSDPDWMLLVDGGADSRHIDATRRAKELIEPLFVKTPGAEGTFGNLCFSHALVHQIGGEPDANSNTTRRILLLLESEPVGRADAYERVVTAVLNRYLLEDQTFALRRARHHVPRFLLNGLRAPAAAKPRVSRWLARSVLPNQLGADSAHTPVRSVLMRAIGFSTGALALGDFRKALAMLSGCSSASVVELSALRECELAPLVCSLAALDLDQFAYVAVHAPSAMEADSEKRAVELLDAVALRDWPIVVHPDAIHDWTLWRHFGPLLCVENMDKRKAIGRSHVELAVCFDRLPDASLCADLGHARQVDPTMTGAHFILRDFADRLRQVHLSEVSTDSRHDRISYTCSLGFREVAALVADHIPIVLETPVTEAELEVEIRRARATLGVPSQADSIARSAGSAVSPAA